MMHRRDFVKMLGLLAAGAAARPEQIEAFTKYYDVNTPRSAGPFVAIDEVFLSGMAGTSTPIRVDFTQEEELLLPLGYNAFGGVILWHAPPDGKIVVHSGRAIWNITYMVREELIVPSDLEVKRWVHGHVKYLDQDMVRHTVPITTAKGVII